MSDTSIPPGLELESRPAGMEVYRYTDPSDSSSVVIAVDNCAILSIWEVTGNPEIPWQVVRWLLDVGLDLKDGMDRR